MPVWRNAFSSSHDHLHLEAHESFTKPTQHVPSPVSSFVSPRKRARPFNAQIWRKMEERARDLRAASRSFVPRNFYGEERKGAFALSLCPPSLLGGGPTPRPDPPVPTSSSFSIRHAALHLCLGSHQSGKKCNICTFTFKLNKSVM